MYIAIYQTEKFWTLKSYIKKSYSGAPWLGKFGNHPFEKWMVTKTEIQNRNPKQKSPPLDPPLESFPRVDSSIAFMVRMILKRSLNFNSHLEKSLNSVKVLEKPLKFTTLFTPHHFTCISSSVQEPVDLPTSRAQCFLRTRSAIGRSFISEGLCEKV